MASFFRLLVNHVDDVALVIYTGILVVWGWIFAVLLRKKWGSWRHSHREPLTGDEWVLIVVLLAGLVMAVIFMLMFLHGKPPNSLLEKGARLIGSPGKSFSLDLDGRRLYSFS